MITLGIHGAPLLFEDSTPLSRSYFHDAGAVLVQDGRVVAGVEEERFTRRKHWNRFPLESIRFCLEQSGLQLDQVDRVAVAFDEDVVRGFFATGNMLGWNLPSIDPRALFQDCFERCFGSRVDDQKLLFFDHHRCHAVSGYAAAGWDHALIASLDGWGDRSAGYILNLAGGELSLLYEIDYPSSLGFFYYENLRFIGYDMFDEGKVMALASYGNPETYAAWFQSLYALDPEGAYRIDKVQLQRGFEGFPARKPGAPFLQEHKDFAAGLQQTLETIAFHLIGHFAEKTGQRRLVMTGGVALNCVLGGKLLYSGLFERVFVPPTPNDSGLAMGAALAAAGPVSEPALNTAYLGPQIETGSDLDEIMASWGGLFTWHRSSDIEAEAAGMLAQDLVIGWVQGRTEMGPRALGNRSILGAPHSTRLRDHINGNIKFREAYRPLAPVVTEEDAHRYFEIPQTLGEFRFMTTTLRVKPNPALAGVTHVDGTARIQSVPAGANPRFHRLLRCFEEKAGVPVLLNTSFNRRGEPIVNGVDHALQSFWNMDLDALVIDDLVIRKRPAEEVSYKGLAVTLSPFCRLQAVLDRSGGEYRFEIIGSDGRSASLSRACYTVLMDCRANLVLDEVDAAVLPELSALWKNRHLQITPADNDSKGGRHE